MRKQVICWRDFIRAHMEVLVGTDFFTVEVLTLKGLVTYYVLFFMHLESSIKAAATPSGWLYKPETLSEISVTTEQFCSVRI